MCVPVGKPLVEDCTFKQLPPAKLKSKSVVVSIQPRVVGKLTGFGAAFQMPDTAGYQVSVKWSKIESEGTRSYQRCYGAPFMLQISGSGLVAPCASG